MRLQQQAVCHSGLLKRSSQVCRSQRCISLAGRNTGRPSQSRRGYLCFGVATAASSGLCADVTATVATTMVRTQEAFGQSSIMQQKCEQPEALKISGRHPLPIASMTASSRPYYCQSCGEPYPPHVQRRLSLPGDSLWMLGVMSFLGWFILVTGIATAITWVMYVWAQADETSNRATRQADDAE